MFLLIAIHTFRNGLDLHIFDSDTHLNVHVLGLHLYDKTGTNCTNQVMQENEFL